MTLAPGRPSPGIADAPEGPAWSLESDAAPTPASAPGQAPRPLPVLPVSRRATQSPAPAASPGEREHAHSSPEIGRRPGRGASALAAGRASRAAGQTPPAIRPTLGARPLRPVEAQREASGGGPGGPAEPPHARSRGRSLVIRRRPPGHDRCAAADVDGRGTGSPPATGPAPSRADARPTGKSARHARDRLPPPGVPAAALPTGAAEAFRSGHRAVGGDTRPERAPGNVTAGAPDRRASPQPRAPEPVGDGHRPNPVRLTGGAGPADRQFALRQLPGSRRPGDAARPLDRARHLRHPRHPADRRFRPRPNRELTVVPGPTGDSTSWRRRCSAGSAPASALRSSTSVRPAASASTPSSKEHPWAIPPSACSTTSRSTASFRSASGPRSTGSGWSTRSSSTAKAASTATCTSSSDR